MNHLHLLDRIKKLDIATIEKMSPEVMARLTNGFDESLVRNVLYIGTTNHEQRKIIRAVKNAYKDWKKDTDMYWGNPPLFPEIYPQYLENLQMDIECGLVVTTEGSIEDFGNKIVKNLTSNTANTVQRVLDALQESEQTVKDENIDNIENEEEENYMKLAPWEKVRIAQLEEENAKLRDELHQLKEYVKDYITIDDDNEIAYIKDFGVDNDKNTEKIQSEIQNDLEEKENEELKAEIKRLKVLLEATDNQPKRYQEALMKIEEQEETIKDLNEIITKYQMRGLPPAKRKGIALGLTPLQADIFGDYLADKLDIVFNNKKEELSLILNCLFGQGRSSLANKMHMTTGAVDDRLYVASIFGPSAPKIAKEICSDWDEDTLAPWEEEFEYDDEDDNESD